MTGTVTRKWSERVTQTGANFTSVVAQSYEAVAHVSLTQVDIGGWTLAGSADITSTFTSDAQTHNTTSLGPCDTHYTDDASGGGAVDVEGGLEARDGFYQFYVNIPGLDTGTNVTVRDDSGCFGGNNRETNPWSIGPITAGGNGDLTDPNHISGSTSQPREGGGDTVTWSFTINP